MDVDAFDVREWLNLLYFTRSTTGQEAVVPRPPTPGLHRLAEKLVLLLRVRIL